LERDKKTLLKGHGKEVGVKKTENLYIPQFIQIMKSRDEEYG